jgi:hypothetical protein
MLLLPSFQVYLRIKSEDALAATMTLGCDGLFELQPSQQLVCVWQHISIELVLYPNGPTLTHTLYRIRYTFRNRLFSCLRAGGRCSGGKIHSCGEHESLNRVLW